MGSAKSRESITINVPREHFFKVITDYEAFPEFVADLASLTVDKVSGDLFIVTYHISILGRDIAYTLQLTHYPPCKVAWKLLRGDFMKSNEGSWTLEEVSKAQTRATYEIEMGLGLLVPGAVIAQLQKTALPKMLGQFKARAEATYKGK